jgi:hypothetical protein
VRLTPFIAPLRDYRKGPIYPTTHREWSRDLSSQLRPAAVSCSGHYRFLGFGGGTTFRMAPGAIIIGEGANVDIGEVEWSAPGFALVG